MHAPSSIPFAYLLALFSITVSVASLCIIEEVVYFTLDKPFTLAAIAPGSYWSVFYDGEPSATASVQPYISQSRVLPPSFSLTEGKLTTIGADGQTFSAHFGDTTMEYPPPLATVLFGFDRPAEEFRASYNCDEQGKQYLELKASDPLVVKKAAEAQGIFVQPDGFPGTDVVLSFKINGY